MIIMSFLCIIIGIIPESLYILLPYKIDFIPYTGNHIISQLHLLLFSGLAFFVSLKYLERTLTITLDFDWFYRNKIKYIYAITNFMSRISSNFMKMIVLNNIKNRFNVLESYLMKQFTISTMLTLILITFSIVLLFNIS